jgi:F5/8 type C domain/PQQ enzyme repeat
MKRTSRLPRRPLSLAAVLSFLVTTPFMAARAQEPDGPGWLTRSANNRRTGANLSETILNPSNVNSAQFGKLFQLPVDEQVYAQVLYVPDVPTTLGSRNVVYVATLNNSVYAFDADTGGSPIWQRNFNGGGRPTNASEVGQACGTYRDFSGRIGIVGTPVIDGTAGTIYFVTRTVETGGATVQRLRALDIATGAERAFSPVAISASRPGTGNGSVGGTVSFDPVRNNQRASLALSQGRIYIAWSSFCDTGPYHGWVIVYDGSTFQQVGAFVATPNGDQGGIWQSGGAPAIDDAGVYYGTGNGTFNNSREMGESLIKLSHGNVALLDFFTPSTAASLNAADLDFGSGLPMLVPGAPRLVTGGKDGRAYLIDLGNLGHMGNDSQIPQVWTAVSSTPRPNDTHNLHNGMAIWDGPAGVNLYTWGENDFMRAWRFNGSTFNLPAFAVGSVLPPVGMPGGMLTVSANGSQSGTGIVWATTPRQGDANQNVVPGILRAFNAENLSLLWESTAVADDTLTFSKGGPPTVINGRVYVPSLSNSVSVYGPKINTNPNLALNKPATGSTPCNVNEGPEKAFNGSVGGGNSDKWCSLVAGTKSLQVNLQGSFTVNRLIVRHAGAGGESTTYNTRAFTIDVSTNGSTFTQVVSVGANTANVSTHDIPPVLAQFVRLNVIQGAQSGANTARIYELEVHAPAANDVLTFETELLPVAATSGDVHRVALDTGYSRGQGTILEGNAVGDFVGYNVNVPAARTYNVRVRIKRWGNRGIWQLGIDGVNHGAPVDGYSAPAAFVEVDIGSVSFGSSGTKAFRFQVTGTNASSTSDWIALDYVKLTPQ